MIKKLLSTVSFVWLGAVSWGDDVPLNDSPEEKIPVTEVFQHFTKEELCDFLREEVQKLLKDKKYATHEEIIDIAEVLENDIGRWMKSLNKSVDDNDRLINDRLDILVEDQEGLKKYLKSVASYLDSLQQSKEKKNEKSSLKIDPSVIKEVTPQEIMDHLNKVAVGQEKAKKKIALLMAQHSQRVKALLNGVPESELDPPLRAFVVGESGSGKTFLLKEAASVAGVPFFYVNASILTSEGYNGRKFDEILSPLVEMENGQYAIVLLDELDKLHTKDTEKADVNGDMVQKQILTRIEDDTTVDGLPTKNLCFIGAGAFSHIDREETKITKDVLIHDGRMCPELMGRLKKVIELDKVNSETYLSWLKHDKSLLQLKLVQIQKKGVSLRISEEVLQRTAKILEEESNEMNFRSAQDVVEQAFEDVNIAIANKNKEALKDIPFLRKIEKEEGFVFEITHSDFFKKRKTWSESLKETNQKMMLSKKDQKDVEKLTKQQQKSNQAYIKGVWNTLVGPLTNLHEGIWGVPKLTVGLVTGVTAITVPFILNGKISLKQLQDACSKLWQM